MIDWVIPYARIPDTVGRVEENQELDGRSQRLPLRMLNDRLLVRPEVDASERQSAAGLVIPISALGPNRLAWAKVASTGENVRQIEQGQRVLYDPVDRPEVEINGTSYVLLREKDIHAVAQEGPHNDSTGLYL